MQLGTAHTFRGVAGTNSAITYTIFGDAITTTDSFTVLAQGQLSTSISTLYTVPASTQTIVKTILYANTTAFNVSGIIFYVNGITTSNQANGGMTIPAYGSATYHDGEWKIYDAQNILQYVGGTGPSGTIAVGSTTTLAPGNPATVVNVGSPTAAIFDFGIPAGAAAGIAVGTTTNLIPGSTATVANSGTSSAAIFDFGIPVGATIYNGAGVPAGGLGVNGDYYIRSNATGDLYFKSGGSWSILFALVGPAGVVTSVTNSDGTIIVTGTGANPIVSRAGITGDVAIAAAGNTSVLATVNANTGTWGTATQVGTFTVNGKGLITSASNTPISITAAAVSDFTESAQDAVGAMVGASLVYIDGTPLLARAALTGDVTSTQDSNATVIAANVVSNAKLAQMVQNTLKGRALGSGTGDPADLTQTQVTALLNIATGSLQGAMSASDKAKLDNLWYDVTNYGFIGNDSFDNGTVWSAFFSLLPVGATVYFPGGTYRTTTEFDISADKHLRFIGAGKYVSIIKINSTTANAFRISGSYWYNTFEDMGFQQTGGTPTAGAGINIDPGASGSAVGTNIYRCWFNNLFIGVRAVGQQAANLSVWDSIDISSNVVNSRGCIWTGEIINMIMSNSTINLGYPPFHVAGTACMEITHSGAIQLIGGEYIGGTNTLLLNGSAGGSSSVAAIYATNCFFDQSAGSTVKVTGANIVNRVKFVQCGITGGNIAGATAVEIASTGTGAAGTATAKADGVDFFDCDIYPNGGSGTTRGFLVTGAQGVTINACRISGWTEGIAFTPSVSNGYTKLFVTGNKIGATNNFTTPNGTGLVLNAGSFQYGAVVVTGNDFQGSTIPLVEGATVAFPWQEYYDGNVGIVGKLNMPPSTATQAFGSGATGIINGGTISIPTNGLRVGNTFRWRFCASKTGAGTSLTLGIKFGVNNSAADANIATAAFTGTGVADTADFEICLTVLTIGAGATAIAYCRLGHKLTTTGWCTTSTGTLVNMTMTAFNSTVTNGYLNLAITANTATVPTFLAPVTAEILR